MILRIILCLGILIFFLWDYKLDPKAFKRYIFPIVIICFFGSTEYFLRLDDRIRLLTLIVVVLLLLRYAWSYYNDYKIERFREKKRIRSIRERDQIERDELILKEILDAKNQDLRERSTSYEIIMDFSDKTYEIEGQLRIFEDSGSEIVQYRKYKDFEDMEEIGDIVLENQIGMFPIEETEK